MKTVISLLLEEYIEEDDSGVTDAVAADYENWLREILSDMDINTEQDVNTLDDVLNDDEVYEISVRIDRLKEIAW